MVRYRPNWIESEWYPWDSKTNSESCVKNEEYHPLQQTKSSAWCAEHAAIGRTDSQNQKKNSWKILRDSSEFGFMNWPRRLNGLLFWRNDSLVSLIIHCVHTRHCRVLLFYGYTAVKWWDELYQASSVTADTIILKLVFRQCGLVAIF